VFFIFQLELDTQLQRALNYDAFDAAQQIRHKRELVGGGWGGVGGGGGGRGRDGLGTQQQNLTASCD
jgi:hypothetical protein